MQSLGSAEDERVVASLLLGRERRPRRQPPRSDSSGLRGTSQQGLTVSGRGVSAATGTGGARSSLGSSVISSAGIDSSIHSGGGSTGGAAHSAPSWHPHLPGKPDSGPRNVVAAAGGLERGRFGSSLDGGRRTFGGGGGGA